VNKEKKEFLESFLEYYAELSLKSLLEKITNNIRKQLACEDAAIFLYHQESETLSFETVTGNNKEKLKKIILKKGEGIVGWIAETRETALINDCLKDNRFTGKTDKESAYNTKSLLGVPVIMDNKLIGVVEAINKLENDFNEQDKDNLIFIAKYISIPIQNALLFRKANRENQDKNCLIEFSKLIATSISFQDVFKQFKKNVLKTLSINQCEIFAVYDDINYSIYKNVNNKIFKFSYNFSLNSSSQTQGEITINTEDKLQEGILDLIKGLSAFVALNLERNKLFKHMVEKEKMENELKIAKDIQESFIKQDKVELSNLDVSHCWISASAVGGDYFHISELSDNEVVFSINDIAGHGISASLLMSVYRTNFLYQLEREKDILKTISYLNLLLAKTTRTSLYVSSFTFLLNTKTGKLKYINAGHTPALIIRDKKPIVLKNHSLVVGVIPSAEFELFETSLEDSDIIVLYTDGITEAENKLGEEYSQERMSKVIAENSNLKTEEIKNKILIDLKQFSGTDKFEDDITLIIVKWKKVL